MTMGLSRVYVILSAISFHYRRQGKVSPCDHVRVKLFMRGLKRLKSKIPVRRARPFTTAMLKKAVQHLVNNQSLVTWRTVWRMCVGFSCFLRWDDVQRLQVIPVCQYQLPECPQYLYFLPRWPTWSTTSIRLPPTTSYNFEVAKQIRLMPPTTALWPTAEL